MSAQSASSGADAAASAPLIEIANLSVSFPAPDGSRTQILHGVSLEVGRGEVLALVGESGSGKSVTSRTIVGLPGAGARVTADRLRVAGHDALGLTERQWRGIRGADVGFVLQDALASLDSLRRVGSEIAEPLKLHTRLTRRERADRVEELLALAGVPEPALRAAQYPHELSGGLRQRALIASAIAAGPRVLIADEPTTALDATIAAQILRLLRSLVSEEGALLMVSHDLGAVAEIADRIAVMNGGRIVEQGPAEQVLFDPQDDYTKRLLAAVPSAASRGQRLSADPAPVPAGIRTRTRSQGAADSAAADADAARPVLEARSLSKRFRSPGRPPRTVLDDVSFVVARGRTVGLVGESGSGKTTAARILLGVETADEGEALVDGTPWSRVPRARVREVRHSVQSVSQDPLASFDPRYTVGKVLAEALREAGAGGSEVRRRSVELLDLVRLPAATLARRPLELSGGQRQRIAIARALAVEPDVIVADEPVSALDVSVQARVLDLFADIQREAGVAYLFISHDLGVIRHVADEIVVLKDGRVVEAGDAPAVLAAPQHAYTQQLLAAVPELGSRRAGQTRRTERTSA